MTLPPASANRSRILALTSADAPQPQSSPEVIVPSATSEIRTPDLPKSLYLMRFPPLLRMGSARSRRALCPRGSREVARAARMVRHRVRGSLSAWRYAAARRRGLDARAFRRDAVDRVNVLTT